MSDRPYALRSSGARYGAGDSSRAVASNATATSAAAAAAAVRPPSRTARKIATPASRIVQHSAAAPSPMKGGGIGNLTFEQREEIRDLFDTIDQQSRGYIPVSKLPDILQSLGLGKPAPEQWARWKLAVDPEGIGKLGYQQLEDFISLRYDEMDQKQEILNAFSLFKPDSRDIENAKITLADLKRVSAHLGENIPDNELQEMINIADPDNNGSVGFADFMRIMRKSGLF
ncbi:centrin, EF-hand protein [Coemansia sp. RSA 1290]|nr:hypothetical protein BX667DRAFT_488048 [Coemansia mojavensis]KAJ1740375.1 centrin, EF-hand protein [Coemansia sp. RSA 1086]KAJ1748790.1 centrin, EF-hand protein [Coemansia sp. RSA 1821]KAJ1870704.1 centrin, EF-hand protein [Coemansia sp. RSA 990]KAJ2627514.1 centrin, EF-hand protein [Coemansia sp. RSA 1290]KAJ2653584.1 centrin, EF-hand protein [Coemansia sp. RSA 1250]KAJ2677297.1 centrin, EF-hand protein [Coemansia sp. RSA 1085]